jgi:nitroreductase
MAPVFPYSMGKSQSGNSGTRIVPKDVIMTSKTNDPGQVEKQTSDTTFIPATDVTVYEALYQRRMAWRFKEQAVPDEALRRLLDTAVWAPNHRLTEPWRFFVLGKDSSMRQEAARLAYEFSVQGFDNTARAEAAREMVLDPPFVVFVYCVPGPNEDVTRENYAAVCCAVQNMALAGVAEGLAVTWETGRVTRPPELRGLLGAEEDWGMAGMLSIGFPDEALEVARTPVTQFVTWFQ